MTITMKERTAREIAFAGRHSHDSDRDAAEYWEHTGETGQRVALNQAERALEAIRNPTEVMLDGYWKAAGESVEMRHRTWLSGKRYHQAMIDAAINETPVKRVAEKQG